MAPLSAARDRCFECGRIRGCKRLRPEMRTLTFARVSTSVARGCIRGCKGKCVCITGQIFRRKIARRREKGYLCGAFANASQRHVASGFSAVGSALRSGRRGRAFESPNPDSGNAGEGVSKWACPPSFWLLWNSIDFFGGGRNPAISASFEAFFLRFEMQKPDVFLQT